MFRNIFDIYKNLLKIYGPQGWWPILTRQNCEIKMTYGVPYTRLKNYKTSWRDPYFEIALGAILTQNTAWNNVALALRNLYHLRALTPTAILKMPLSQLQKLIRSAGYFRQKAKKLKIFSRWIVKEYDGNIINLKRYKLPVVRKKLLSQWGIGRETADSIILYALNKPIFVIDTYTKRLCEKHGIIYKNYEEYQKLFESKLKREAKIFQEYHALIVASGKEKHILLSKISR